MVSPIFFNGAYLGLPVVVQLHILHESMILYTLYQNQKKYGFLTELSPCADRKNRLQCRNIVKYKNSFCRPPGIIDSSWCHLLLLQTTYQEKCTNIPKVCCSDHDSLFLSSFLKKLITLFLQYLRQLLTL